MPKTYIHSGDCPRCGAPVFAVTEEPLVHMRDANGSAYVAPIAEVGKQQMVGHTEPLATREPPSVHYTCDCRAYMPGGIAGLADGDPDETVDNADRKTMARRRAAEEPDSVERAD